jgi:hypothetical protein
MKKSNVMLIANHMVGRGVGRAEAMRKAWKFVNLGTVETKVAGTTFERRQEAIEHLQRYSAELINIALVRDAGNEYDPEAVKVLCTVEGKGSYMMGFIPRPLAAFVAPLIDAGKAVSSAFDTLAFYGLNIAVGVA